MIPLTKLNAKEGFLVNGKLIVVAKVEVLEVVGELDVSEESSSVTIDVNGFQVLLSQVINYEKYNTCRYFIEIPTTREAIMVST